MPSREYEVLLGAYVYVDELVQVTADSEQEAAQKAIARVDRDPQAWLLCPELECEPFVKYVEEIPERCVDRT